MTIKKDEHRYIDKEKTTLKTANNLYKESLSDLSATKRVHQEKGIEKATPFYSMIEDNLSEALLFGKAEAAGGLAYLHRGGLGVRESEHNYKLFIAIGDKLGDPACKKMAGGNNFSDVEQEANAWVKTIKEIEKKYPNKDEEITAARLIESRNKLNETIKNSKMIEDMKGKSLDQYEKHKPLAPSVTPNMPKKANSKMCNIL